jgi:putative copper export protein
MSTEPEISLPAIVIVLRVVGCLCPVVAVITAGATNASDAGGWLMVLSSLIASLLWFALASVIRLLNRIEKRLSHSDSNVSFLSGTTN